MTFQVTIITAPNVALGRARHYIWHLPTATHMRNLATALSRKPHTTIMYCQIDQAN
jgi:hypothetical protein